MPDPVYFLTRPDGHMLGEPLEARPCRCERPWRFEPGQCCRCGRLTAVRVAVTWGLRRRQMARRQGHQGVPARRLEPVG